MGEYEDRLRKAAREAISKGLPMDLLSPGGAGVKKTVAEAAPTIRAAAPPDRHVPSSDARDLAAAATGKELPSVRAMKDSVPDATEVPPDLGEAREKTDSTFDELSAKDTFLNMDFSRPGGSIREAGEDYASVGGPGGKEAFVDAFYTKPKEIEQAMQQGVAAEEQLQAARAKTIGDEKDRIEHQNAEIQLRHQARQAEIQQQNQQIQEKVQYYTNDLADTGKFWRNPGNIMAAFGAALMTLASDDHAIGYKLINNAIQQDLHNRQKLADMHLGELRSNLAGYRQIAGDEFSGDLLAESEAKRTAALELERLGAQFAGPKAKAASAAISKKFLMDSQNLMMQFYNARVYNRPEAMTPQMKEAWIREGKALPGVGYTPYGGYPATGATAAQQGGASAAPMSLRQSNQAPGAPQGGVAAIAGPGGKKIPYQISAELQSHFNKRYPGVGGRLQRSLDTAVREAYIDTGKPPGTLQHSAAVLKLYNKAEAELDNEKAKNYVDYVVDEKGWRNINNRMRLFKASAHALGVNPDQMIGWMRNLTPEGWAAKIEDFRIKWNKMYPPDTPAGKTAAEQREAVERIMQALATKKLDVYHAFLGGAMSPQELKLAEQMLDTSGSWGNMENFARESGQKATARASGITLSPLARTILDIRVGQKYPQTGTTGTE